MDRINYFPSQRLFAERDRNIVIDLYQYYFNGGFHSIITEKITRLLISYFMIFLYNFLINCIDYPSILYLSSSSNTSIITSIRTASNKSVYQFIDITAWLSYNPYLLICFSIYCLYLILLTLKTINIISKFSGIRDIYRKYLEINDYRIKFIAWDNIVNTFITRLNAYGEIMDSSNINIYTVNNRICHQSNIIISIVRNSYIALPKYSKFLEWNYIFCIIDPIITTLNHYNENAPPISRNSHINLNESQVDTIEYIQDYKNRNIYKLYNQPLLSRDSRDAEEIECNVLSVESSTNPNADSKPFNITRFDSVLYNTLTENMRGDGTESLDNVSDNGMVNSVIDYINRVHYRIQLVFWINLISIPFTVIILGLYLIIKYGEQIYRNPGVLFQRQIDVKTKWKLRYYNELPNLYGDRLMRIERNMDKIINTYNSSVRMVIVRFLTFLVGSVFLIVLVLSFIAAEDFLQLEIVPKHNLIWFLGVSGTMLLILNKLAYTNGDKLTKTEQIAAFDALREDLITIHPQLHKVDDREYLVSLIHDIYRPRIMNMMHEIMNLILSPYYLWKWRKEIYLNAHMILGLMENHHVLGNVCRHSIFTNRNELLRNPHMLLSLKEFKMNHNWSVPSVLQFDNEINNFALLQQSILDS